MEITVTTTDERTPVISLRDVSIRYSVNNQCIGKGICLDIYAGETVLLLGPSGCGKSTLLLAMSGLIPASLEADLRGQVLVGGKDSREFGPGQLATNVGIVFQDPDSQVITGSLLDEVCFGLENLLVPVDEIEPRALAALRRVGLIDSRDDALVSPTTLSGGGRQRLAIACALALDPPVLVLDEPTANLDPAASAEFYATIASLKDTSRAIILVEHQLDDALPLADRMVVLDAQGTISHDGPPAEVIGKYGRDLSDCGIWLPTVTAIALKLGFDAHPERLLPSDVDELVEALVVCQNTNAPIAVPCVPRAHILEENTAIDLTAVSVKVGGSIVLHDIDLQIKSGEFLAIAGINGAGKSTLARVIAGLLPRSSGLVTLAGTSIDELSSRQIGERIGYVFQNPEHQFLARCVRDELAYGLRVRHRPEHEINASVDRMLARFDLTRYAGVNPFLLSHGEKRRLSVATALITEPDILILDEPTFGQDQARAHEIIKIICELNTGGITTVVVSHDMQLVAEYADRVALLSQGRIVQVGTTSDILRDTKLIERAGLRLPPWRRIARDLARQHPEWEAVFRSDQIRRIAS